jgi:hypothetical protein
MLDDFNVIKQRDPHGVCDSMAQVVDDVSFDVPLQLSDHDGRALSNCVVLGDSTSLLHAECAAALIDAPSPIMFCAPEDMPSYLDEKSLVICIDSGTTPAIVDVYKAARQRGCQIVILSVGGTLHEIAKKDGVVYAEMMPVAETRRSVNLRVLRACLAVWRHVGFCDTTTQLHEVAGLRTWLTQEAEPWHFRVPVHENYAKQLALLTVGKTPIFYSGGNEQPLGRYFQQAWQQFAKNVAFASQYPAAAEGELSEWLSHPIEKPYIPVDIAHDTSLTHQKMSAVNRVLSGKRPKSIDVLLRGDSVAARILWGMTLGDSAALYVAMLNNVRPDDSGVQASFYRALRE